MPLSGFEGNTVIVNGNNFIPITAVLFNGISAEFMITNNNQMVVTIPAGATTGFITVINPCGLALSAASFTIDTFPVTLNLKLFLENFYLGHGLMAAVADPVSHPDVCDSITVELHHAASPFYFAHRVVGTINTSGNGSFNFPSLTPGFYFIAVRHRNSIETWSKNSVLFNSPTVSFDFTSP